MADLNVQLQKYNSSDNSFDKLNVIPANHGDTHASTGTDPVTPEMIGAFAASDGAHKSKWTGQQIDDGIGKANMVSNRNLLDNWWFGTGVINQRGSVSGATTSTVYTIDRWKCYQTVYSLDSNGLHFKGNSNVQGSIQQLIEYIALGKTYTLSAIIDGTLYSESVLLSSTSSRINKSTVSSCTLELNYDTGASRWRVVIRNTASEEHVYKAVKLELGSVSTLANDHAPDYAEELSKCQRYYQRFYYNVWHPIFVGNTDGNSFRTVIKLATNMRADNPSVSLSNNNVSFRGNGAEYNKAVTVNTAKGATSGQLSIIFTGFTGVPDLTVLGMNLKADGQYMEIVADL